jgi:hypothetical protein
VSVQAGWSVVQDHRRIGLVKRARIDLPAHAARELVLERMARLDDQELADIAIVDTNSWRNLPGIVDYVPTFLADCAANG